MRYARDRETKAKINKARGITTDQPSDQSGLEMEKICEKAEAAEMHLQIKGKPILNERRRRTICDLRLSGESSREKTESGGQ